MSKKHNKRSRAEILAKRNTPVVEIPVRKNVGSFLAPIWKALPTHSERLRAAFDASKYMPHFGAKQREKLTPKWKRAA
ncbi:hypothetical protein [Paraburkholderia tropica]|uniref:hypothetical protein n=1 Tax=Paraburkholderia tropica TaxID=92647 RepID=UPI002AB62333|nr:hypothetical protein [Paraburkholderia tropica]